MVPGLAQIGRYQLLGEVARGGMGAVYRARGPDGQLVALKLLLAGKTASPLHRRRVATEVQALLRIRHPHVVALLDAGEHEGVPYLVMEWVEGESLAARLRHHGPLDPRDAVELVARLADALAHCHAQGVLHRDLKPDNVLLRAGDGQPLLVDFGISKDMAGEHRTTVANTVVGRWLGTPGWWPPEQAHGKLDQVGPRSDVYGLGALLYAALTGSPPQEGRSLPELIRALERPPVAPSLRQPGVPPWLDAVCLRALAPDPAERPTSAEELARELRKDQAGIARASPSRSALAASSGLHLWIALGILLLAGVATTAVALLTREPAPTASAPPPAAPDPPELVAEATAAWRQGRYERAFELADALLADPRADHHHAAAHRIRALIAHTRGERETARETSRLALELARDPGERALGAALVATEAGDGFRVLRLLDEAIGLRPHDADALLLRGAARQRQGDLAGAIDDYSHTIEIDPRHAVAHFNRAAARQGQGDLRGAIEDYSRTIEIDPRHASARANRGLARHGQGDLTGAIEDYSRMIATDPRHAGAHANRGLARQAQGDLAGAIEDFERAAALYPPGSNEAAQARALLEKLRASAGKTDPGR